MRIVCLILGIILTFWTVLAVIHSMLIPSGQGPLIARAVTRAVNALAFAPLSMIRTYSRQNKWLAGAAPISVLLQLVVYVVILIFTTGLIVFGTTEMTLLDSLFQSGATLTTLGIVEPVNVASTITTFVAAFLGLVVIAIFIGYLMNIFNASVVRESQMARLSVLSGEPAWGPQILARNHVMGLPASEAPNYVDWTNWICQVRLNQLANPVLGHFRSTSPYRHWVISLLAVMDATALRIAFEPDQVDPHAMQLLVEGGVALSVLDGGTRREHNWDLQYRIHQAITSTVRTPTDGGLTSDDWNAGISALQAVQFPLPADLDSARDRFRNIRSTYIEHAYSLARQLHAVPAPWSGQRSPGLEVIWPQIARAGDGR